ncbi:hypothetical protein BCR35DRAFT_300737 [Leucosporidium creatinivorum]|uniref:Uncharacterized protein n=1 Tax=Leucosporidium creatinivorum TaxID=106004 RepID=A0A1Y2FY55_9BASI|nr:hypothetical protein BCR35DRAFT_300737 [Leucosporidium creatinivorum]
MARKPHPPQEASEDSVLEVPLHQLVDPAYSSSSAASGSHSGSIYGGVAPSTRVHDYHDPYASPSRPVHDSYDHSSRSRARTSNDNERRLSQQQPHQYQHHYEYEQHYQQAGYPDFPPIAASRSLSPPHTSAHDSNALPAFSRWSPTWQSGGYSGDGKGYTNHPPPASALEMAPRDPHPPHLYPHRAESDDDLPQDDEEGTGGWIPEAPIRSEWQGTGGEYRHGVGYDSQKGSSGKWSEAKIAERIRKLEKEFGTKGAGGGAGDGANLSLNERMQAAKEERRREKADLRERSGVDGKGRLVVLGAKKRAALRWAQGIEAVVVGAGSIGASLFTKPLTDPPPKGTIPIYLLYLLPFLSLALTLYLFAIRPCLQSRRAAATGTTPPNQFAVPLVQGGPGHPGSGGGCCCFGTRKDPRRLRGPGGKHAYQPGTTVNLLVDPSNFPTLFQQQPTPLTESAREKEKRRKQRRRRRRRKLLEKEGGADGHGDDGEEGLISSSSSSSSSDTDSSDAWSAGEGPRSNQRKGILSAVALEGRWKEARGWLKKVAWWDAGAGVLWLAVGVYAVGWGEKCSPGGFQGFCNFYNTSLAFAILLAVSFFLSLTFDILDLRRTRAPPRLRQRV